MLQNYNYRLSSRTFEREGRGSLGRGLGVALSSHSRKAHPSLSDSAHDLSPHPLLPTEHFGNCSLWSPSSSYFNVSESLRGLLPLEVRLLSLALLQAFRDSGVRGLAVLTFHTTHHLAVEVFVLNLLLSNTTPDSPKF